MFEKWFWYLGTEATFATQVVTQSCFLFSFLFRFSVSGKLLFNWSQVQFHWMTHHVVFYSWKIMKPKRIELAIFQKEKKKILNDKSKNFSSSFWIFFFLHHFFSIFSTQLCIVWFEFTVVSFSKQKVYFFYKMASVLWVLINFHNSNLWRKKKHLKWNQCAQSAAIYLCHQNKNTNV